jgi:excisionase family DNA binding protein
MREKLLTVEELADLMRLKLGTVYKLSREGSIPGRVKLGGAVRFRESAIKRWIEKSEQEESEESR